MNILAVKLVISQSECQKLLLESFQKTLDVVAHVKCQSQKISKYVQNNIKHVIYANKFNKLFMIDNRKQI